MAGFPATADILLVGGGSAGAVLAARLSQDPARSRRRNPAGCPTACTLRIAYVLIHRN